MNAPYRPLGFVVMPDRSSHQYPFFSSETAARWAKQPCNAGQRMYWTSLDPDSFTDRIEVVPSRLGDVVAFEEKVARGRA